MQLIHAFDSMNKNKHKNDYSYDFCMNNCGHYSAVNTPLLTKRDGFDDYLLVFVENGAVYYKAHEKTQCVSAGQLLLYLPKQPHNHAYATGEKTSYYWIHFGGRELENRFPFLNSTAVLKPQYTDFIVPIFENILQEVALRGAQSFFYTEALGLELLYRLNNALRPESFSYSAVVCQAIQHMKTEKEQLTVAEYAAKYRLNTDYFIRIFKKETGYTPKQYRLNILIDKAKSLLLNSNLTVQEIANQLGFSDALYFSHSFKKRTNLSPTAYRKRK